MSAQPRPDDGPGTDQVNPRLFTVKGAAAYLGLTPWQVRGLIWRGILPSVHVGRLLYLDRKDLDVLPDRLKRRVAAPVPLRRSSPKSGS